MWNNIQSQIVHIKSMVRVTPTTFLTWTKKLEKKRENIYLFFV